RSGWPNARNGRWASAEPGRRGRDGRGASRYPRRTPCPPPPVTASFLRLLLCLCLLVDTLGPAVAGTHLALARVAVDAPRPASVEAQAGHGCHDAAMLEREAPAAPDGDCLERWLELCLQHGVAMLPAPPALPATVQAPLPAATGQSQRGPVHAGPPLRPPIGYAAPAGHLIARGIRAPTSLPAGAHARRGVRHAPPAAIAVGAAVVRPPPLRPGPVPGHRRPRRGHRA